MDSRRHWLAVLACTLMAGMSVPALAADEAAEKPAESSADGSEESEDAEEEKDEKRESANGSYEWKRSWGAGLEAGFWFQDLDRWNATVAEPNAETPYDLAGLWHFDLAIEASLLENTRLSLFGGFQSGFSDPSASAFYGGFEPAFVFRKDMWEVGLGIGVGFGAVSSEMPSAASWDASLLLMRPFLEVRRYLNDWSALYLRAGFNQWVLSDPEFDGLVFTRQGEVGGDPISDENLNVGGPFMALGFRLGSYPEHIKYVEDVDGDGYRDDVDECPEEAEDFDKFEDEEGCPETDNDKDSILDAADKCPLQPEDKDGWQDEDGCPETDDDMDGDGLLNVNDQCPKDPEDIDGFEDTDGCPEADNDHDGVLDAADKCPLVSGVPEKDGCPYERVQVTLQKIVITDKVFFDLNKASIKSESFSLLDEVAKTMIAYPRIKKVEVQGHTDHAGKASYNKDLSTKRAKSVMDYLVSKGVPAERLTSAGYGSEQPLVPLPETKKETPEGAEQNRRVEFVILEQEEVKRTVREDQIPANVEVAPKAEETK